MWAMIYATNFFGPGSFFSLVVQQIYFSIFIWNYVV